MEEVENQPKKMCIFCHAQVNIEAKICPFCRAHFDQLHSNENASPQKKSSALSEKQTLDSLYPPPYQPKMEMIEEEKEEKTQPEKTIEKSKNTFFLLPIFLFTIGSQLLVFSLFLFLFSQNGMLFLKWKASFWYLYLIASIGFLLGGYKLFSHLEES